MTERFLHHLKVERPPDAEDAAAARERLRDKFPRSASRRMTHLGLLIGAALDGAAIGREDAVVYATTFGETRALEDFLRSFPTASPLGFQTSIHPGGVQQVLIGRQQPIARLWPLAGRARLVEQALVAAMMEPAERVALVGGEERGTWLRELGIASERSFAFAALLTREPAGAVGRIAYVVPASAGNGSDRLKPELQTPDASPTLEQFADALADRRALAWGGFNGDWSIEWR
jgi:hypothetical protein